MSWHRCERWWAREFHCVYHRVVTPEEKKEDDDDEEDEDPDSRPPWPRIRVLAPKPKEVNTGNAVAEAEAIVESMQPVTADGRVIRNWAGDEPAQGPLLVPVPTNVFEGLQDPALVPPGGLQAIVPGGFPPPAEEGGQPGDVFNPQAPTPVRPGPGGSGLDAAAVGTAIGIAVAAGIATAIIARFPWSAAPVTAAASRISTIPWFADAHAEAFEKLRLAERAVIDSINTTALLIDAYQADYKERELQSEQTEQTTLRRVPDIAIGPRLLLFNAAEQMDALLQGIVGFGGDI